MVRWRCSALALLLILGSAAPRAIGQQGPRTGPQQQPSKINWLTDKNRAFAEAKKTGKPLWVLFR